MRLSEHFSLAELTVSATARKRGWDNTPDEVEVANLLRLAQTALEPLRALWGCPIRVTSGYRAPRVNAAVGGAPTSAHMDGRAADLVPLGLSLQKAFEIGAESPIPYDQIIIERMADGVAWIHVGIARLGTKPRRQVLSAKSQKGQMRFQRVAAG